MSQKSIRFKIKPHDLHAHIFAVECEIENPNTRGQIVSLPTWIPGSYLIREFAKHVVSIAAFRDDQPLSIEKQAKNSWLIEKTSGPVTIRYEVYAFDSSIRGAYLDQWQALINGTSLFLQPHGHENSPFELTIENPPAEAKGLWRVFTAMSPKDISVNGFGSYSAANYDELVDHPILLGDFASASFEAVGTKHQIVFAGRHDGANIEKLCHDLTKVCGTQIRFFGQTAPFEQYLFILKLEEEGYGGLEHRASTVLLAKTGDLPRLGDKDASNGYRTLLGLFSHEYFHAWNVKRIKPKSFAPYNYQEECYTRLLWVFEGITSYYDDLMLLKSGVISDQSYLDLVAKNISRVYRQPGRLKQSVADSSFDTWIKLYRQDENSHNSSISYYTKGSLVALLLDHQIIIRTKGKKSLDDVMQAVWQSFGQKPMGESDFEKILAETTGLDWSNFFSSFVFGTTDLPIEESFAGFGIECQFRTQENDKDEGGFVAKKPAENRPTPVHLGAKIKKETSGITIGQADIDGPFAAAGLWAGDEIIALNGVRTTTANFDAVIGRYHPGDRVQILASRRNKIFEASLELAPRPLNTCILSFMPDAEQEAVERRKRWLAKA